MVFTEKSNGLTIKTYPDGMDRHIYLDSERAFKLSLIKTVYERDVLKNMSYNLLMKIAIDSLLESLEELSEEEAIDYLKERHLKAFF